MLPRTSSAIPIVDPGSRTATPTKKATTPPPTAPKSPPESPSASKSLGVHAPVFVPRFTTAPEAVSQVSTPQPQETTEDPFSASYHHVQYEPSAYTPYYAPLLPPYALEPLDFHNYHPNTPRHGVSRQHFMTPDLRDELHRKQDALYQAPYGHPTPPLPDEVNAYHSLALLEPAPSQNFMGGFTTSVYRAVNNRDGNTYVLYRVENCRLPHDSALTTIEAWSNVPHPSIVRPHEAFTTRAFNDQSLVVVYEYHPLARTLQAQHLAPSTPPGPNARSPQSSPAKSRTFSPARGNFTPPHFGPGSPASQFAGSPPFNSPAFPQSAFGSPNAQSYGFPQSFSGYSFQTPASRANSLPPSASIAQALSQSASFNSFAGPFSPQSQFSPQMHPRTSTQGSTVPFSQQMGTQPLDERMLWTYLLQLANAVRVVHGRGMAFRCLDAKRVLVTGVGRVRINTVGLIDIMTYDGQPTPEMYLQEDLVSLGSLLLQLVCGTSNLSQFSSQPPTTQSPSARRHANNAGNNLVNQQNLASAQALTRFSPLLRQAVVWLVTPAVGKTIEHLFKEISPAIIGAEMDAMLEDVWELLFVLAPVQECYRPNPVNDATNALHFFSQTDMLESELSRELENGRLVRLLCKFGFINERPEFDHDPRWAETGDRYIIKLFRDHVFHQVDARGKPVLNLTHVFVNLNKLDAGSEERLMLVSRDERNCLVVSYKEIKTCIENAYRDLAK
ncbi:unnamed protein product [Rhizoctonia solani]|uniref:PAN2-PAN3 deadenylation complex subunit PAN3 n=1 Tax=Rhizoctonia solani TaxID=456999 RepID=A0A8H3CCS4_9AGAM|nr:unnamed protein product [Rhizoctonia solani]